MVTLLCSNGGCTCTRTHLLLSRLPTHRGQAEAAAAAKIFEYGSAPICDDIRKLDPLGISIGLYFRFLKTVGFVFFLMSLLAIPALIICHDGGTVGRGSLPLWRTFNIPGSLRCDWCVVASLRVCRR